jgi:DNA-binding CsgD family transcriptional regulator
MARLVQQIAHCLITLHSTGVQSRNLFTEILRQVLEVHPEVFSIWSVWEPNTFDGNDEAWIDKPAHDSTGRFIPSWHRVSGELQLNPVVGYEKPGPGDWYWVPKKTGELCAMDPHALIIGGTLCWISSEIAPLLDAGRTIGVVGIDMLAEPVTPAGPGGTGYVVPRRSTTSPLVRVLHSSPHAAKLLSLTKREREVHYWLCQGKSNDDIAAILDVSPHTVKNHVDHIFQKLGVENRYAAALIHRLPA